MCLILILHLYYFGLNCNFYVLHVKKKTLPTALLQTIVGIHSRRNGNQINAKIAAFCNITPCNVVEVDRSTVSISGAIMEAQRTF
jgi:hypothetical protein